MRHDHWRRDPASYPLRGELLPRYTDVDGWQHLNNSALISMHGESVQQALRSVFGADAWRRSGPVLACTDNATDFLAEAHYPAALEWGARVLEFGAKGVRIATAFFQGGKCVGLHEATMAGWTDGQIVALTPEYMAALRAAQVSGSQAEHAATPPAGIASLTGLAQFPWQRTLTLRFGDSDAHRMASDNWLARCAEQMRAQMLSNVFGAQRHKLGGMMVVHVALRWMRRATPAAQWRIGCGIAHLGERSLAVRGAMFDDAGCVAVCESVMVVVDRQSRRSATVSDEARAMLEPYRIHAGLVREEG